jgi:hypothetical protein
MVAVVIWLTSSRTFSVKVSPGSTTNTSVTSP